MGSSVKILLKESKNKTKQKQSKTKQNNEHGKARKVIGCINPRPVDELKSGN